MSCKFDKEIIQKYIDNTIDPLEQVFLKEHTRYCEECRNELDFLMTAENELDKFFGGGIELNELDIVINRIVDDCLEEIEDRSRLRQSIKMGKSIAANSSRFVDFLPGSKYVKKGVKAAASKSGSLISSMMRKKIKKLMTSS